MFEALQSPGAGQGSLFWAAAAAAGLGAALLSAALVLDLRRRGLRLRRPRRRQPTATSASPTLARAVPGGYAPARPAVVASATTVPPSPDFEPLLARLRRASDRLASLRAESGDSHLKATPTSTEHLYRRGVG